MMLRSKNRLLSPSSSATPQKRKSGQGEAATEIETPTDGAITSDDAVGDVVDSPMAVAAAVLGLIDNGNTTLDKPAPEPEPEATHPTSASTENATHVGTAPTGPAATTSQDEHPSLSIPPPPLGPHQLTSPSTLHAILAAATPANPAPTHAHSHRLLWHLIQSTNVLHSLFNAFLSLEALQRDAHAVAQTAGAPTAPPVSFHPMMLGTGEMMRDVLKSAVVCKVELEKLVEWEAWMRDERAREGARGGLRGLKHAVEGMQCIVGMLAGRCADGAGLVLMGSFPLQICSIAGSSVGRISRRCGRRRTSWWRCAMEMSAGAWWAGRGCGNQLWGVSRVARHRVVGTSPPWDGVAALISVWTVGSAALRRRR